MPEKQPEPKPASELPFTPPRRVGNYEIICKIGAGGMGVVYKARHTKLDSFAAVKFLTPSLTQNDLFVKRFESEAHLAAQLTSPYSGRTFDVGEVDGIHYILMEYVEGETVSVLLDRAGRMPEQEVLAIIENVAQALQEAHELGIIHRDIKPENIMVTRRGVPKLMDLGAAKQITGPELHLTIPGFTIGTPNFMSPEQAQGQLDIDMRSDIYSLGATLYRMVVGELPFKGLTPLSVMHKIATSPVPDPLTLYPSLSPQVGAVICKMMATRREERYQTMAEVIRHIQALRAGQNTGLEYKTTTNLLRVDAVTGAAPAAPRPSTPAPILSAGGGGWRRRSILIGAVIGIALVIIGGVMLLTSSRRTPQPGATGLPMVPGAQRGVATSDDPAVRSTRSAAAALAAAERGDWTVALENAHGAVAISNAEPVYKELQNLVEAGGRVTEARTVAARICGGDGSSSPGFAVLDTQYAGLRKTLGGVDASKLSRRELQPLTATLADMEAGFRRLAEEEREKRETATRIAGERAAILAAGKDGNWKGMAALAETAPLSDEVRQKLKETADAGEQTVSTRNRAASLIPQSGVPPPAFVAAEKQYADLCLKLAALDPAKLDAPALGLFVAGFDETRNAFRRVADEEEGNGRAADNLARKIAAALTAGGAGEWKRMSELAGEAGISAELRQKLRETSDAGEQAAQARSQAEALLPQGGAPLAGNAAAEKQYAELRRKLAALDPARLEATALLPFVTGLNDARAAFDKAARRAFEAAYPALRDPIQGTNTLPGFLELHAAQLKHAELPFVAELAAQYDPTGDCVAIAGALAASKTQAGDYASAGDAAEARRSLDDALSRCDRVAADPLHREVAPILRREALHRRAVACEASANPAGMLASGALLLQAGDAQAQALVDRATQLLIDQLAVALDKGRASAVERLRVAGAELAAAALAPARKVLCGSLASSPLGARVWREPEVVSEWLKQLGRIIPPGMIVVPAGSFALGEDYGGPGSLTPPSAPQHWVELSEFCMDAMEVTHEQFQRFVDAGGYEHDEYWTAANGIDRTIFVDSSGKPGPAFWQEGRFPAGSDKRPVTGLSWYEAAAFAAWSGKALPTEAQWECAAIGAPPNEPKGRFTKSDFPWGPRYVKGAAELEDSADAGPLDVGAKPKDKGPLGCFDMAGNVREWTLSPYDSYPGTACKDRDFGRGLIVVRGACFKDPPASALPTVRRARDKSSRDERIGFRCAWAFPVTPRGE